MIAIRVDRLGRVHYMAMRDMPNVGERRAAAQKLGTEDGDGILFVTDRGGVNCVDHYVARIPSSLPDLIVQSDRPIDEGGR